jgi:hypothetical protein
MCITVVCRSCNCFCLGCVCTLYTRAGWRGWSLLVCYSGLKPLCRAAMVSSQAAVTVLWNNVSGAFVRFGGVKHIGIIYWECCQQLSKFVFWYSAISITGYVVCRLEFVTTLFKFSVTCSSITFQKIIPFIISFSYDKPEDSSNKQQ